MIIGADIAMAAVAADDISGIGVADDGAEIPISAALAKGVAMVFG